MPVGLHNFRPRPYEPTNSPSVRTSAPHRHCAHNHTDRYDGPRYRHPQQKVPYVEKWDIPGWLTGHWLGGVGTFLSGRETGGTADPFVVAIGALMAAASVVVVPCTLVGDIVNTVGFPAKVLYRRIKNSRLD